MQRKKVALLASLGSAFEYYDFVIYGMMAHYLGALFFPSSSAAGALQASVIFAVGYVARPLGGVAAGIIADRWGRKRAFLSTLLLMAGATLGIGLLPSYEVGGPAAPALLLLCRVVQGCSFGAELPGAVTLVAEQEGEKRGICIGLVLSSTAAGSILATVILGVLTYLFSEAEIFAWGWRIPFLLGGVLAVASSLMRKRLEETPAFLACKERHASWRAPLLHLLKGHWTGLLLGVGIACFPSSLVIANLILPFYLSRSFFFAPTAIYFAMTVGLVWSALVLPLFGAVADQRGEKKVLAGALAGFALLAFPLFKMLEYRHVLVLTAFTMLYQTALAAAVSAYLPLLARFFPTSVRYTGMAACYNAAYALTACSPALLARTTNPYALIEILAAATAVSAASLVCYHLREKNHADTPHFTEK
jgi:MFS family permease